MQTAKGTSRYVISIPILGIVIKFAQIHPKQAFLSLKDPVLTIRELFWKQEYYQDMLPFFWSYIFQGIKDNLSEFLFYISNSDEKFLVPTYFSFFGIFNIQRLQKYICTDSMYVNVWKHFCRIVDDPNELMKNSPHTYENPKNFSLDREGKLRVVDYASASFQSILKKYKCKFHSILRG